MLLLVPQLRRERQQERSTILERAIAEAPWRIAEPEVAKPVITPAFPKGRPVVESERVPVPKVPPKEISVPKVPPNKFQSPRFHPRKSQQVHLWFQLPLLI